MDDDVGFWTTHDAGYNTDTGQRSAVPAVEPVDLDASAW